MTDVQSSDDQLIRVLGMGGRVRCVAVLATATVEELRRIHDPSPTVAAAVGRLAMGAVLMAASLEKVTSREPMLTVEVEGDGPAGRLVATASPRGWVRATVSHPSVEVPQRADGSLDVPAAVGRLGVMVVTRDPGVGQPYRGVTPLRSGEIAQDLVRYLVDSEQAPAAVVLGDIMLPTGSVGQAGGLLLQVLPGVSDAEAAELEERILTMGPLSSCLEAGEPPIQWMGRLFPDGFLTLETTPVRFVCGCSRERVERALLLLGPDEIRSLLRDGGTGAQEMTCGFCRTTYEVSRGDLARLLMEAERPGDPPPDA